MALSTHFRAPSAPETGRLISLHAARRRPMTDDERRAAAVLQEVAEARRDAAAAAADRPAPSMGYFLGNGWSAV